MGLENLKSIFQEDLNDNIEEYISNRPTDKFDTKLFNTPPRPTIHIATNPTDFSTAVGNNESPFTPLNQLGESFLDGLSWRKLYNPNHTPKNDPKHKGLTPISYGVNVNRDKLNIRNPEDGRFGFAGSARTSVISAVGKFLGQGPTQGSDTTALLKDTGKEPYIVSNIPKSNTDLTSGRIINSNFLDRGLPIERSLTDSVRVAKFLTSPAGLLFIGKQNLLGLQQIPFTEDLNRTQLDRAGYKDFGAKFNLVYKPFYNPLSSLIATFGRAGGGPAGLIDKTEPGLGGILSKIPGLDSIGLTKALESPYPNFQNEYYPEKSQLVNIHIGGRIVDNKTPQSLFKTNIGENKFGNEADASGIKPYPKDLGLSSLNDSFTGNGTIVEGKTYPEDVGDKHTLLGFGNRDKEKSNELDRIQYLDKIEDAHPNAGTDGTIEGSENGMPFYFKDMRDGAFIFFRAYLDGISETVSPSWASSTYMGRSEPVWVYERAEREINFTLRLFAQTEKELAALYEKMNRLTSLCYPEYFVDQNELGENKNYGNRMKPPLTKLRIGDMFGSKNDELMGYIKNLSYNIETSATYETKVGKKVSKFIMASIGYQVIHSQTPSLKTKFYGYIGDDGMADPQNISERLEGGEDV